MTESAGHVVPFFCPYCGEESLEPVGDVGGGWACRDCRRQFTLKSLRTSSSIRGATS